MLFHTPEFLLLMTLTFVIYYFMPAQRLNLLALADILFYSVGGIGYLGLFLLVTAVSWFLSQCFHGKHKHIYLWLAIALNVANLVFFKYTFFILSNIQKVTSVPLLNQFSLFQHLILPIGISFYTFELIAYLADVYNKKIPPSDSLLVFWVFISFFPHRVAGPIMRGKDLIPQLTSLRNIDVSATVKLGLAYLAMGLFKKIIIADNIAIFANNFFAQAGDLNSTGAWVAAYLYTFQIYYDFSAYSDMAVGIGYLFGIRLDLNFKTPYLSANATEFWRRWHITLSNWIRDYIYIPLGGSWYGTSRRYLNLFIAMSISGLWHGAAWTFIAWGMYHGVLLIVHNIWSKWSKPIWLQKFADTRAYQVIAVIVFFHLICVGWVLFRIEGIHNGINMIMKMLTINPFNLDMSFSHYFGWIVLLYLLHIAEHCARSNYRKLSSVWHNHCPVPVRALIYTFLIAILIVYTQTQQSSFIYFKF